jgi:predicted esterase
MTRAKHLAVLLGIPAAAAALFVGLCQAEEFARGSLVERVVCLKDAGQSYALYLPSSFDPARPWPALFLFDAGARGPLAVQAFRDAAETYGWILVGSNNSRNGPARENGLAAVAVWEDVSSRLPLDGRRIYTSGFSGGARVGSSFPRFIGRAIAGTIGCGAGLASGLEPGNLKAGAYFGIAGLADFNYGEMKGLDRAFDPSGVPHRFFFFEGTHDWPDPASCSRAVAWLEIMAMKQGLRPKDRQMAAAAIGRELDEARVLEAAGRIYWAVDRLEAAALLAEDLDLGLPDLTGLAARIEGLKARREFGRFLGAEKARDLETNDFRAGFSRAFGAVEDPETGGARAVPDVLREMKIAFLRKDAKSKGTVEERSLASRLLFEFSFAAQSRATELYRQGDLVRVAAFLDLAIAACEEGLRREKGLHFDRACVAAVSGEKKTALKFLSSAVDKGFADLSSGTPPLFGKFGNVSRRPEKKTPRGRISEG